MAVQGSLDRAARTDFIQKRLLEHGRVSIAELARELDVSEMTIRRELEDLEAAGVARRVRGGAIAVGAAPAPFAERHRRGARAKGRIAAKLVPLVPSTGLVGVDASSTLLRLAAAIPSARELSVITNGLETFAALQGKPGITPLLTGGTLEPQTGSLIGPLATRAAMDLLLDRLFVSAAAIDPTAGTSEACLTEAEVKRVLGGIAGDVVVAADASKLGTQAMARAFEWGEVSLLVTELDPADQRLDPYRDLVELL